ncbi:MAG: fibronectin type III domain-containing protein [Patescibacteria group bacterium]
MNIKRLSSAFLAVIMSFSGFFSLSPALAFADNDNGNKNKSNQEIKEIKKEVKQEQKEIKKEVKKVSTWGAFMSAMRSNRDGNKFLNWFWWNKNYNNTRDDNNNNQSSSTARIIVSNVAAIDIGTSSSAIRWNTNKLADSKVYYGTTSPVTIGAADTLFVSSGTLLLNHKINLTDLIPDKTYYFKVVSTDSSGNAATSSELSFVTKKQPTADVTLPNILFATNIGSSTSTVSVIWVTNEASNSKIWFGNVSPVSTTTAPIASVDTLSFFHQLSLPSLATSTLYYYTVGSSDAAGNTSYYSGSFTSPNI